MSDLRVLRWLRSIDAKLDEMKADRDRSLAEIDTELQAHEERLDGHDRLFDKQDSKLRQYSTELIAIDRKVDVLTDRFDRALEAFRTGKRPPKKR